MIKIPVLVIIFRSRQKAKNILLKPLLLKFIYSERQSLELRPLSPFRRGGEGLRAGFRWNIPLCTVEVVYIQFGGVSSLHFYFGLRW